MAHSPKTNGRKTDGTFAEGNRLGGRKPGSRHKVSLAIEALLEGEHEKLTRKAVELALEGDTVALRLCLDRLAPIRRDAPVSFALPPVRTATDAAAAGAAVLDAMAGGGLTPDEAGRVMAVLTSHKAMVTLSELEERIAALEDTKK